jgi:spore maturation protein CgeD
MLKQAVASVLCQTHADWQLILAIDYLSPVTNDTTIYCERMALDDSRIVLDYTDLKPDDFTVNRFAHNINRAFRYCSGDYVSYLCDDDLYVPWRLATLSEALDDNPDWNIVYNRQLILEHNQFTERDLAGITRDPAFKIDHNSVMHRRHCFDIVGGWDETKPARLGDAFFFQRLAAEWPFYPVDCIGEVHRLGTHTGWSGKEALPKEQLLPGAPAGYDYPEIDDQGNCRTIQSGVDPGWSRIS